MRCIAFLLACFFLVGSAAAQSPNPPTPVLNLNSSMVTPTNATTSLTIPDLAAQQGVLLDTFRQSSDANDTASLTRAVAAGVPILLGPRTYTVNNFSTGAVANFILSGVPGRSVIQRTSASGSQFFAIGAVNVAINGVTFDMNKANVTANQWGVFMNAAGQNVTVRNSVFKNNSGSLGTCLVLLSTGPGAGGSFTLQNNEITGCTFNPLYLASVSNGDVDGNYIHDNSAGAGMYVLSYGAASGTNYSTNIIIRGNTFLKNSGSGIAMGSFVPPYAYGNPAATWITVSDNIFQDNTGYQLGFVNTDHVSVIGNKISQSSASVSTMGGIDCNSRYFLIEANDISMPQASWGIDCGGAVEPTIRNNNINMGSQGAAIDVGGVQNGQVLTNHIDVAGTATAVIIFDMESDGALNPFPNHTSNVTIQNNDIIISGVSASGVQTRDNAGATTGALPIQVLGNKFVGINSAGPSQDVSYLSAGSGIIVQGNLHNGLNGVATTLNGNNDYVFETVYDYVQGDLTAGSVRSIINGYVNAYNAGTKILWVLPTAGGSGYTSATTLSANGGCTWTGSPLINSGVIIGVRTNSSGASCSAGTIITATDTGGGSGATFSVGVTPNLPTRKMIQYRSAATAGNTLQLGGGAITVGGAYAPIALGNGATVSLTANGAGSQWLVTGASTPPSYTVATLPTCNSSYNKSTVMVTDASAPTYNGTLTGAGTSVVLATCNGTAWTSH